MLNQFLPAARQCLVCVLHEETASLHALLRSTRPGRPFPATPRSKPLQLTQLPVRHEIGRHSLINLLPLLLAESQLLPHVLHIGWRLARRLPRMARRLKRLLDRSANLQDRILELVHEYKIAVWRLIAQCDGKLLQRLIEAVDADEKLLE